MKWRWIINHLEMDTYLMQILMDKNVVRKNKNQRKELEETKVVISG